MFQKKTTALETPTTGLNKVKRMLSMTILVKILLIMTILVKILLIMTILVKILPIMTILVKILLIMTILITLNTGNLITLINATLQLCFYLLL